MTAERSESLIAFRDHRDAKGDTIAAVMVVNDVDSGRFREIEQTGGR
jgi:hypothetical protein